MGDGVVCELPKTICDGDGIYLRVPQCLQAVQCQERPSICQVVAVACCLCMLLVLLVFIIQTQLTNSEADVQNTSLPVPTEYRRTLDRTLFSYGPDVHYGIVVDCGSSGSRVYVYIWPPHSGNPHDLLNIQPLKDQQNRPVAKKVTPGLDTFASTPESASEYVRPLLEFAASHIPRQHHRETLLYILATAGMRMLDKQSQDVILLDLQKDIPKDFDFVIAESNFEVISGKQEGVYAWIAVNYVLQKFGHGEEDHPLVAVDIPGEEKSQKSPHVRRRTVGMIDMGGGSMQIAFEVTSKFDDIPKHQIAEFNLGCDNSDIEHTYRVYVTTFLGFGANEARTRYEQMLISKLPKKSSGEKHQASEIFVKRKHSLYDRLHRAENVSAVAARVRRDVNGARVPPSVLPARPSDGEITSIIHDPCLPQGLVLKPRLTGNQSYRFKGTGDFRVCQMGLVPLLNLSVPCTDPPCSMNGVHQPTISFRNSEFYGFSEFWYTMEDVYRIGGQYDHNTFEAQAMEFCGNKWSTLKGWYDKKLYPHASNERFRMECFKSAWMTTVLHKGVRFPVSYADFHSAQFIHGRDVQWTLGALIHRTRYLPLREIEMMKTLQYKPSWLATSHAFYNEYLIVVCFIIVVMAILLYVKRLHLCKTKTDLSRVPSMSYFMTDLEQTEPGIRFMKNYVYPDR